MAYQDYILLSLLWIAYCVVHSALISVTVTDFLKGALGDRYRFYRLFFNIFSVATLVPLLIYSHSSHWRTDLVFTWEGHMRIIQYGMIALAAILVLTCLRHYNMLQFLGIRQILRRGPGRRYDRERRVGFQWGSGCSPPSLVPGGFHPPMGERSQPGGNNHQHGPLSLSRDRNVSRGAEACSGVWRQVQGISASGIDVYPA